MEMAKEVSFVSWLCGGIVSAIKFVVSGLWWKNKEHREGAFFVIALSVVLISSVSVVITNNLWVFIPLGFGIILLFIGILYSVYLDDMKKKGGE